MFPLWRNLLNSLGIASFGWGAIVALGPEQLPVPITWLGLTAAVTFTTIHSQDLPGTYVNTYHNRCIPTLAVLCSFLFQLFDVEASFAGSVQANINTF